MYKRLVLASASPRRHDILNMAKIPHVVNPGDCDESQIKETDPAKLVEALSKLKAFDAMSRSTEGDLILASDTVVAINGEILGKPHSDEEAAAMVRKIAGTSHEVFTGVTIVPFGKENESISFHDRTVVNVAPISDDELADYIKTGESKGKAGAYAIQGIFGKFVTSIEGDYYNVMGLPLAMVYANLKRF